MYHTAYSEPPRRSVSDKYSRRPESEGAFSPMAILASYAEQHVEGRTHFKAVSPDRSAVGPCQVHADDDACLKSWNSVWSFAELVVFISMAIASSCPLSSTSLSTTCGFNPHTLRMPTIPTFSAQLAWISFACRCASSLFSGACR